VPLPAAICREAGLQDNQTVELRVVVAEGVLIRPLEPRLTLAERLAASVPDRGYGIGIAAAVAASRAGR
jgi:antitoxin component of MazEF toxin-antitoxin module